MLRYRIYFLSQYPNSHTPCERNSVGYIRTTLFVRLSACPTRNLFCLIIGIPYFAHGVSPWDDVSRTFIWSWYNIDLWPQGQNYRVSDMALCSGYSLLSVYVVIPHLAHKCITMWWCVIYIYGFCVSLIDFLSQYQNYIFTMNLCVGKIVFALWQRHTKFCYKFSCRHVPPWKWKFSIDLF